jgi:hypothetical protein
MSLQRCFTSPDAELQKLHHRRTELDNAIRLLEEIRLLRSKRTPEVAKIVAKVRRVA